ncbi:farnesyl pyrophosphate synthase [Copidosoma floridanum]|uniref:farnesyl pyrophosphate synthase n=1 Tax=Copidosoma floridanum TaxID=29053 RepID=UPI0006C9A5AE|nr:farnesyl pyrophosphate synthase [Copidosoma floridanum]XP_014213888.1 farnesyl pyrophosphate synthase [Copidosoma floridanum]
MASRRIFRSSFAVARGLLEKQAVRSDGVVAQSAYAKQLRTSTRNVYSMAQTSGVVTTRDESREMMAIWPDVVRDLTDAGRHLDVPDATKWLAKVLQYNVPSGKKNRGLSLVYAYRKLAPLDQLTDENIRLSRILGWSVEMLQAHFLVMDDLMDNSQTRRGQPCWYRQNDLGAAAINDGILLEHAAYQLLRIHFSDKPCYLDLVESLQQNAMKTSFGQALDLLATNFGKKPNLNLFTMDKYNSIVKYKTAFYSFVLPVQLAMYFAGIKDPEMHRQAKTILLEMGHFFQVQDDYLDCFGDPEVTGKHGTDIQEGKCSWLVVVALQRASPEQRRVLEECYGVNDLEKVAKVKRLYTDLGLPLTFSIYEEETYNLLNTHIQQISRGLPHDLFFKFIEKIYRRDS